MTEYVISDPIFKTEDGYLNPLDWHGHPDARSPWSVGETCWYVVVEWDDLYKHIAAETPLLATGAAERWAELQRLKELYPR